MLCRFKTFFGLRDFIHFINYIRRKRQSSMSSKLVLQSLERNFNGTDYFTDICTLFMEKVCTLVNLSSLQLICKGVHFWGINVQHLMYMYTPEFI